MALILTRNLGQSVIIGNNIVVKVLAIRGEQVSLAIDAPKSVSVHRSEIQKKVNAGVVHESEKQPQSNANVSARDILRLRK